MGFRGDDNRRPPTPFGGTQHKPRQSPESGVLQGEQPQHNRVAWPVGLVNPGLASWHRSPYSFRWLALGDRTIPLPGNYGELPREYMGRGMAGCSLASLYLSACGLWIALVQ